MISYIRVHDGGIRRSLLYANETNLARLELHGRSGSPIKWQGVGWGEFASGAGIYLGSPGFCQGIDLQVRKCVRVRLYLPNKQQDILREG